MVARSVISSHRRDMFIPPVCVLDTYKTGWAWSPLTRATSDLWVTRPCHVVIYPDDIDHVTIIVASVHPRFPPSPSSCQASLTKLSQTEHGLIESLRPNTSDISQTHLTLSNTHPLQHTVQRWPSNMVILWYLSEEVGSDVFVFVLFNSGLERRETADMNWYFSNYNVLV